MCIEKPLISIEGKIDTQEGADDDLNTSFRDKLKLYMYSYLPLWMILLNN